MHPDDFFALRYRQDESFTKKDFFTNMRNDNVPEEIIEESWRWVLKCSSRNNGWYSHKTQIFFDAETKRWRVLYTPNAC